MGDQQDLTTKDWVELRVARTEMLTSLGCQRYREAGGEDMLDGYSDGIAASANAIQQMLTESKTYDDLKNTLSNLVSEQKTLLVYILDTWPGETLKDYKESSDDISISSTTSSTLPPKSSPPST